MYNLKIHEFLNDKLFDIPFKYSGNFQHHLDITFNAFLEEILSIDDEFEPVIAESIENIKETCREVKDVINLSFLGKMSQAFDKFSVIITRLQNLMLPSEVDFSTEEFTPDMELLFRARENIGRHLSATEMFHRPFQDRYNIPTYRFSLPGMPCLYLSNSTYTCWEELNRPTWSQMYISFFKPKESLNTLNLEYQINKISPFLVSHYSPHVPASSNEKVKATKAIMVSLNRFFNLFPIYVACYTTVSDPKAVLNLNIFSHSS